MRERLHEIVRKEHWGYASSEALDNKALIKEEYKGIRPAPGYPACPEHTEKALLWKLIDPVTNAGISLTDHFAMMPAAVVGDSCVCVGPPDSIVRGSATVMIGGKPAARIGDSTAHGGSIVMGAPTVMIGG